MKRGYVQTASLTTASAPSIPSIKAYTNFTSGTYAVLETVNETTLNDINRAGFGKNFESNGTILLNFSWTKGQQYNDIKEQIV